MTAVTHKDIAQEIRKGFEVPASVSDEEILRVTKGTLTYALVELRLACRVLIGEIIKAILK